jgi:uncharacterized membrane protein (DUF106 family)
MKMSKEQCEVLMDNMKLMLICILRVLLSHSFIFFVLFFINVYMVLFLFDNVFLYFCCYDYVFSLYAYV